MSVEGAVLGTQVILFQLLARERSQNRGLGVGIFARLARVYHGTEDDVRAIGRKKANALTASGCREDHSEKHRTTAGS
jgi:hypothetical protein